jgi:hypothetical protein
MRNNLDRLGLDSKQPQQSDIAGTLGLNFVVPTEYVDLPSKGLLYPEGHPLCGKDTIEIRYMTAKDEDTLTNQSLLKKGVALEKVIQDLIVDKSIAPDSLLVGDKNAIVIAARRSAYGADYETKITCPSCGTNQGYKFDLNSCHTKELIAQEELEQLGVQITENKTFVAILPVINVPVELRLLTGKDEVFITNRIREAQLAKKDLDFSLIIQLRMMIKSINNISDSNTLDQAVGLLPAKDSRFIRDLYQKITPNIDLSHNFVCKACSYEARLEVPFTADFFWPK